MTSVHIPKKMLISSAVVTLALSLSVMTLDAQEKTPVPMPPIPGVSEKSQASLPAQRKQVHLGISVAKPSAAVYAQLPKLPRGSGFTLQSVMPGGTAATAGLMPMDVIWKLDEQILINESQMMVLLSLHSPGDKVKVSYFHSGQAKETTLTLQGGGKTPPHPGSIAITPPFPTVPALPMRVISYEDRSASISDANGTATLTFREGKQWLHVESSRGEETFNGYVAEASDLARVPAAWRGRLPILQRSLEESILLRRLPRVRRVPTPKQRIAGDPATVE